MKIKFIYELEHEGKLTFLVVLLRRTGKKIYITVYRKTTNDNVYWNCNTFAPNSWKRSTRKRLIERDYQICSIEKLQNESLNISREFSMKTKAIQNILLNKL